MMRMFKNHFVGKVLVFFITWSYTSIFPRVIEQTRQPIITEKKQPTIPSTLQSVGEISLARVQKEDMDRIALETRSLAEIATSQGPNRFTQTEAYLQLPQLRERVTKEYYGPFEVVRHMDVVSRVMVNEAKFKDTHWAFYHGLTNNWIVPQDLYTKLYNRINGIDQENKDFIFVRFGGFENTRKVKELLTEELTKNGLISDQSKIKNSILSVNLSLWGNTGLGGEASWIYFMKDTSHEDPSREMYEAILNEFKLPHTYTSELMGLARMLRAKQQSLLQIFIPKNLVDDIAYLAWSTGIPAHQKTIDWVRSQSVRYDQALENLKEKFVKEREKNPLYADMLAGINRGDYGVNSYLKMYCNKPSDLESLNYSQARLVIFAQKGGLLDPASGIKIFRHTNVENSVMEEYEKRLDEIIEKIIAGKR